MSSSNSLIDHDYFVLIADTHIDQNLNATREGENMADNLRLIVQRILEDTNSLPAGVIINGDAANRDGKPQEYANIKNILTPLSEADIPVYITMGNHDRRDTFFAAFPDYKKESPFVNGRHIDIIETPHTYLFLLDTLEVVNNTPGILGTHQREWLTETLSSHNDKPVILIGHHYPWANIQNGNWRGLKDYAELLEICHANRHVKAYIFGHSHRWDLRKDDDLHLVNQPTSAGTTSSQPTACLHARFNADNIHLEIDCIDRTAAENAKWQGLTRTLNFRSGGLSSNDNIQELQNTNRLHQNFPNPVHSKTVISYELAMPSPVLLQVFNSDGQLIKTLIQNKKQNAGFHKVNFDAAGLPDGAYVYRLNVGGKVLADTMFVTK